MACTLCSHSIHLTQVSWGFPPASNSVGGRLPSETACLVSKQTTRGAQTNVSEERNSKHTTCGQRLRHNSLQSGRARKFSRAGQESFCRKRGETSSSKASNSDQNKVVSTETKPSVSSNSSEGASAGNDKTRSIENPPPISLTNFIQWGGRLPNRRRFLYSGGTALAVILGGNLGGVTSGLLALNPEASRQLKLDTLFPVQGFKRCIESGQGFEFIYPADWLGDQRLLYRAVERAEQNRSLDLPPIRRNGGRNRTEPIVAFGPAAGSGELNVSVVVAPIAPGFRLQSLGSSREAGQKILDNVIAREGSGKTAELLKADASPEGKYYTLEYTVRTSEWNRHNVSVYSTQDDQLYSINVMCPEAEWARLKEQLRTTAASFRLIKSLPLETFAQQL